MFILVRNRKAVAVLLASSLLVSMLLSACGVFTDWESVGVSGGAEGDFDIEHEGYTLPFDVPENTRTIDFDLTIQVEKGAVVWRLKTPAGLQLMGGQLMAGESISEKRTFSGVAGRWMLEMEYFQAKGAYGTYYSTR